LSKAVGNVKNNGPELLDAIYAALDSVKWEGLQIQTQD
jgi:hypothetical protein